MTPQPVPPENVRVVVGGREIPVECVYTGRRPECGCALWIAVMPIGVGTERDIQLRVDMMPAETEIYIQFAGEPL